MSDEKPNHIHRPGTKPRPIKSFVLRQGRRTKAQQYALDTQWPEFGIEESDEALDFVALFGNDNPVTLEIGFGNGDSLATMAKAAPERNFIGIEVHSPGVGHLLHRVNEYQLTNVRVMNYDASEILNKRIVKGSLDRLQLYFPDPWHKKRHNKRRIVQPEFAVLIASLLKKDGVLHMATDWEDYAVHMAEVMEASTDFANCYDGGSPYSPRPAFRPLTKFENRGLKLGHGVWDLLYYKL
uniref:tRNA (guanine-N(7)-)-methyltransferase n=1 Tax=uncultured Thiotrichaceae bacterium TaxID=298394 RepID=A0A6S6U1E0_9GAMM|nr:MAG: tRNA (guanine46-N7-)-methyltransferase (EC [uncultured Thiotrichaceae bacterium]